jgi:iron complex outermembrane receptor protein
MVKKVMTPNCNFRKKSLAVAVTAACMTMTTAPQAQESEEGSSLFEEIVVTATRRESTVQDIPYNISAMSGDAMELQNMVDQYDVLRAMHGVTVVDRGYRNAGTVNSIVIRGLNVDNGQVGDIMLNAVPTVATYFDNTPIFANFILKDIERVEVLRGPQGTLYGSGSLGGTVRYIGNRPDFDGFDAKVSLDYGQTSGSDGNNIAGDLMLNFPMGEKAALRASLSRIDNDGIIDYINTYQLSDNGDPLVNVGGDCIDPLAATDTQVLQNVGCFESKENADTVRIDYAKVALRLQPTDSFDIQLTYQAQSDDIGARRSITLGDNNQPTDSPLYFEYGDDDSGQVMLEPSSRDVELVALDFEWDLGFATFTSNTSTYDHEGKGVSDNGGLWQSGGQVDGTSRDWSADFYGGGWPRPMQAAERGYQDEAFIQEFRLVSNDSDGNFDWLVGVFYMDQDNSVYQLSHNPGMNAFHNACVNTGGPECAGFWPATFYPGDQLSEIDFEYVRDTSYEETAIYGELTYHFTDSFRLTGGFRWFDNETVNDSKLGYPLVVGWTVPSSPQSTDSDDDVLIKINASWDFNESNMVYATYSEGYRHGGAQAVPSLANEDSFGEPNAEAIRAFGSDTVQNYELGLKGGNDRLRYTVSLFSVDWADPQLNTETSWYSFYIADNGDKASTSGIELELEGYFTDSFHYRLGYTHVDAELDADFISTQTDTVVAPAGSLLPGAPTDVISLSMDYSWELSGSMDLIAGFNVYNQSKTDAYIDNTNMRNEVYDAFSLVGATLSLVSDNWTLQLYGKNLGDEGASTGGFTESHWSYDTGTFENWYGNGNRQFIVQPLTVGLKVSYNF